MTRGQSILMALGFAGAALAVSEPRGQRQELLPYKQLTTADFRIDDRAHPDVAIYTEGYLYYRYDTDVQPDGKTYRATVSGWTVQSGFDRGRSSRKGWLRDVESTLPHEQGHLDINEIYARTLTQRGSSLPTGEGPTPKDAQIDLDRKVTRIANEILFANRNEQALYDRQTFGGRDFLAQNRWNSSIRQRMIALGISR